MPQLLFSLPKEILQAFQIATRYLTPRPSRVKFFACATAIPSLGNKEISVKKPPPYVILSVSEESLRRSN